jgi:murein L,D-transpeptidase YcbB/YkuD
VLEKLAASDKAADALDSYNPPQPEFKALREKLAELRHGKIAATEEKPKPAPVHVAEGKILRPGMKDARVIALRQRLNVSGDKSSPTSAPTACSGRTPFVRSMGKSTSPASRRAIRSTRSS